ncbi:MAG TPA: hypothetical protein VF786_08030 [Terriglobales bacterium]
MSSKGTPAVPECRQRLIELLDSIESAQLALRHWDAAAFERAVAEQQRVCDLLEQSKPSLVHEETRVLLLQVHAALRSYHLIVDRGTRWCQTLSRILGEPAVPQSVNLRSEL